MTQISIGDLAWSFQTRAHQTRIKSDVHTLSQELASGQKANPGRGTAAAIIADLRHHSRVNAAYSVAAGDAQTIAEATQASLGVIAESIGDLQHRLLQAGSSGQVMFVDAAAEEARAALATTLSALNTTVAGQSIFSGSRTSSTAVVDGDTVMAAAQTQVAAATTAEDANAAIDAWFDGGGFRADAYLGSAVEKAPQRISPHTRISEAVLATDARIDKTLRGLVKSSLIAEGLFAGLPAEREGLAQSAANDLLEGSGQLTMLRAEIGLVEARIDTTMTELTAERSALDTALGEAIGADPFEAATALQAAETQLEMLYTMIARMSRLSLAEYLR